MCELTDLQAEKGYVNLKICVNIYSSSIFMSLFIIYMLMIYLINVDNVGSGRPILGAKGSMLIEKESSTFRVIAVY